MEGLNCWLYKESEGEIGSVFGGNGIIESFGA